MLKETKTKLKAFIEDEFQLDFVEDELSDETNLVETGIVDSFSVVALIRFVESEFGITVPDEDLASPRLASLEGMAEYVERRLSA